MSAAVVSFVTTLGVLVTTSDTWATVDGFPVPSGAGGLVVEDVFLPGAAAWSGGEALRAARDGGA